MINITFGDYFKKGLEIAKLNEKVIGDVSKDENATTMAILFFAIGGALTGLLGFNPITVIMGGVSAVMFSFIWVGILHILAKLFGGRANYMDLYRALGIGSVINWLAIIPLLNFLVALWIIVVEVVVIRKVHSLSTGKAIVVVLIPIIVISIILFVLAATLFAGLLALSGASGGLEAMLQNLPR